MSVTISRRQALKSEWNDATDFDSVKHHDTHRFSWKCTEGHEWVASFHARWYGETKCPYCVGQLTVKGVNSFADLYPDLLEEWDWEKNTKDPYEIFPRYGSVWWKCSLGHSWKSAVKTRVDTGIGCAYCEGRKTLRGFNSLKDLHPEIASEWDYSKNTEDIDSITLGSNKIIYWKCKEGHEWYASMYRRVREGRNCPSCAGYAVIPGVNSLADKRPDLVDEWDYEKNAKTPKEVSSTSKHNFWWVCSEGHEWEAAISNRVSKKSGCPYCSGRYAIPGETSFLKLFPELAKEWSPTNDKQPDEVRPKSRYKAEWVCECGYSWVAPVCARSNGHGCPKCARKISNSEHDLANFVQSIVGEDDLILQSRNTIPPYEVDIFIPALNIAIEFNGIFWHSTKYVKNKNRHYTKWKLCRDEGIQLITVWEDDWHGRKDVVKSMLKHKLGVSSEKRVYARKTTVSKISLNDAKNFLDKHHIQGRSSGKYYLGLKDGDDLVAVMVLRQSGSGLELARYASSCVVVGGQSKLLSWVDKNLEYDTMKTFADLCVSDGDLYEKTGWTFDGFIRPDYKYVLNNKREHKFNYRKNRFKKDPNLKYGEGLTERELAELNGLHRIYDCGKMKYVRQKDTMKGMKCQKEH